MAEVKVLIINSVCGTGSTGKICRDLYEGLKKDGHDCCIAYGRGSASKELHTYKIGNKLDNYWHVLETRLFDNHGFASRRVTKEFISFIISYKPDVIHLHNIHGYYLNVKMLFGFLKKMNIPVIWTLHDAWGFSGHAAYIEQDENGELPKKNYFFSERYAYPKSFFNRSRRNWEKKKQIFTDVENLTVVTPSDWLNNMVKKSFLNEYHVITINNGINLEKFDKIQNHMTKKKHDAKEIIAVANIWEKRKGLDDVIYFADKLSDSGCHFTVVGKVNKPLPNGITHINRTDNFEQLIHLYQQADIFINPTYQDNFPTTNIESLAAGTPVITYNTGGSGEVVNEKVGHIVMQGNREDFINKICELEKNPFVERQCKMRAKQYSTGQMYEKYLSLYCNIVFEDRWMYEKDIH
mgnify:CR=1 FL=1